MSGEKIFLPCIIKRVSQFLKLVRPIALSALSLFFSFFIIQSFMLAINPTFSLLANKGVGKIVFTILVMIHALLLLFFCSKDLVKSTVATSMYLFKTVTWIGSFFKYFFIFFCVHVVLLLGMICFGYAYFTAVSLSMIISRMPYLLLGFIATFFLAWTEECIFRVALFTFFKQYFSYLSSIVITSIVFSLAHNLTHPLILLTTEWKLGLGLFLLGILLNLVYHLTRRLYVAMGIHAGLVFVKVILRKLPLLQYKKNLPWWLPIDLRQSLVVHALLLSAIIFLMIMYYKRQK